ncbi:MAG: prepilin-type N-terminal cleavage/methylation domain-containing protein [Planctomycetes bacterium]|nr:prepilin-type N-terminal cleavage/methylation domain-containing protein [Planctomycetota bacterium]
MNLLTTPNRANRTAGSHRDGASRSFLIARAGVTLFEVLIVLAILAAVAGIVIPSFDAMVGSRRIKNSADRLFNELSEARVKAMRTGQAQVLKATLQGRSYSITPWLGSYDSADASAGATVTDGTGGVVETSAGAKGGVGTSEVNTADDIRELDDRIQFFAVDTLIDSRNASAIESEGGTVPGVGVSATAGAASGESNPVMLYPDGSATTAQIVIADERGRRMVVQIRGVTGQISIFKTSSVDPSTLGTTP